MKITLDKDYNLKTDWNEITLLDADRLLKLEIPKSLKACYEAPTEEDYQEAYKEITSQEHIKEHPKFFGEVIAILADVPSEVMDLVGYEDRIMFYHDFCEQIFIDVYYVNPKSYDIQEIKSFEHNQNIYYLPETLTIFEQKIPMFKEKAVTFAEEADIMTSLQNLEGADGMAQLCAVMCREKGEDYDEHKAIERAESFKDLPMSVVWEVFFCTIKRLNTSLERINTYFPKAAAQEMEGVLE